MTENKMFCFQCQETAKGTGCTIKGVCGKEATTSKWQDLLLSVVRGIGTIQHSIGKEPTPEVTRFLTDALFTTITNANFNDQDILQKVDKGIVLKKQLLQKAASMNIHLPAYQEVTWGGEKTDYEAEGARESVLRNENADIRSLKELTMLGLKGMAAYYEHAAHLGEENSEIISFICRALATISNPDADMNTLVECILETGRTHQIRVHMKHIGHVLFNDERYGGHEILKGTHFSKYKQFVNNCFDTCPRQALHAMTLGFVHPATGEEMYFTSEMPEDMTLLIDKWRGYISNRDLE